MWWRIGIGLVAAIIILANAFLEGVCANRWRRAVELEAGMVRLNNVPMTIGDWHAESQDLDEASVTRAGIEGYFFRHYQHQLSGKKIAVLLMCGRPGPLAVHTPDICYRGAGFSPDGAIVSWPQKYGTDSATAQFSRAKFSKDDATDSTSVRIAWSWGTDGQWLTPSSPRATFARQPVLYKLYLVQRVTPANDQPSEEICKGFVEQLLPEINKALYAPE